MTYDSGPCRCRPRAVAITMSPKRADPLLRFYDLCPAYERHEAETKQWLVRVCVQC